MGQSRPVGHGMMSRHFGLGLTLAVALALVASSPSTLAQQASRRPIRISGSSTVYPIVAAGIRAYRQTPAGRSASISLKETGSTAGFRDLCSGRVEISNASRPINRKELAACAAKGIDFIEVPLAFDAISVVVHPSNSWVTTVTIQQLSTLWNRSAQGRIKRWSQVNPGWPAQTVRLCGAGSDSGTFDYFNKAVNGNEDNSRRDYTASEDDNVVVNCVAKDPQSLGYVGYGWFRSNAGRLKALAVVNPKGRPVPPSNSSVLQGQYQPLSRPLFIYINSRALLDNPEVRGFSAFLIRNTPSLVAKSNYIPLPDSTIRLVESKLYRHILGTSFGGDLPVGMTIGNALQKSFDEHKKPEFR